MSTDHAEQARIHLQHARNSSDAECDELAHVAYAQVHATLALVAEQRAANIIAIVGRFAMDDKPTRWIADYLAAAIALAGTDSSSLRRTDPFREEDAK